MAGLKWRFDTRHVAVVLRDLGLEKSTPVVTQVAKRPKSKELPLLVGAKPLNVEDTTLYKSVAMRVNNLSAGPSRLVIRCRPLGHEGYEESRDERISRNPDVFEPYLRGRPGGAIVFEPHIIALELLEVFCDADHAGDLGTRKSRSAMAVHVVDHT